MKEIVIRPALEADFEAIWTIFCAHIMSGESYVFTTATSREAGHQYWLGSGVRSFVAVSLAGRVLGMYRLVPNQVGRGQIGRAHV